MLKSLFHWKLWLNVLIILGIFSGLVWGTFRWLEHHTNYGKEVPVPNVVNMQVQEAVKQLENMGLSVEVDSFKYEQKYKPFQVLQIYPAAGSRVKEGRTIVLKVNPKTWAKVEVPNILEKYKGLAFSRLELVGLSVGDTIYEASIQKDAVLKMYHKGEELKPGALLPRFSVIDLVIGEGPMRDIPIPNVVGLTVKEAREIIKSSLFEVGLVDFEDKQKEESDIVFYQDPATGSLRDQGMQIDIWASKKTPAEMQEKVKELDEIYKPLDVEKALKEAEAAARAEAKVQTETKAAPPKPKKPETEKPDPTKEDRPKENKKTEEKPKAEKPKIEQPKSATPTEKPKPKKVVVE